MVEWEVKDFVEGKIQSINEELARQGMISLDTKNYILSLVDNLYKEISEIETL